MKKITALTLGFIFIVSGLFIFGTEAHVSTRHGWKNTNRTNIRPFSGRLGSYSYRRPTRRQMRSGTLRFTHPSMRANTDLYAPYRSAQISYRKQKLLRRIQSPELYPRYMNELQSKINVVRNDNYTEVKGLPFSSGQNVYVYNSVQDTYQKALTQKVKTNFRKVFDKYQLKSKKKTSLLKYIFETPRGFTKQGSIYRSSEISLAFRVTKNTKKSCNSSNIKTCAVAYRKGFVNKQNLNISSRIKRVYEPRQIFKNNFSSFPVVTESFYANGFGKKYLYFLFTALNPENGSLVHIEAVSQVKDRDESAKIIKKMFSSFQF